MEQEKILSELEKEIKLTKLEHESAEYRISPKEWSELGQRLGIIEAKSQFFSWY